MSRYFLGVDVGGTKSHAVVTDDHGRALGFGHAGAGNYEMVGWEGLEATLTLITEAALSAAGVEVAQLSGAGFGIAGYDWPGERSSHLRAIASLGLQCPLSLVNDTIIGLVAGAPLGWGIGVVAGTGCNCWGRDKDGNTGRVTGEGHLFAEYGGGGDLVTAAVQAISLAWSRRGPVTRLTDALVAELGAVGVEDLLEGIVLGRYLPSSEAAPLIFEVAAQGDAVALDIVRWAGRELGGLVVGVARQLHLEARAFDIVQIGSLFDGSPLLGQSLLAKVRVVAPEARALRLQAPPVVGAVMLAMEEGGVDFHPLREQLLQTSVKLS